MGAHSCAALWANHGNTSKYTARVNAFVMLLLFIYLFITLKRRSFKNTKQNNIKHQSINIQKWSEKHFTTQMTQNKKMNSRYWGMRTGLTINFAAKKNTRQNTLDWCLRPFFEEWQTNGRRICEHIGIFVESNHRHCRHRSNGVISIFASVTLGVVYWFFTFSRGSSRSSSRFNQYYACVILIRYLTSDHYGNRVLRIYMTGQWLIRDISCFLCGKRQTASVIADECQCLPEVRR